jgi:LysR family transcriptional regulator of gallate degradation
MNLPETSSGAARLPARSDEPPRIELSLRRLRAAVAVCEHGSVARAADAVHRSAAATTRAVLELEAQFGRPLFERSRQGLRPTDIGRVALPRIARALAQLRLAEDEVAPGSLLAAKVTHQQLQVAIALAEQQTQTRAAQSLRVTQPAVTRTLRELEGLVRKPLFFRSARGMVATAQGQQLVRRAKLSLAEIDAMAEEVAAHLGRVQGRVVVGVPPLSAALLVPRAVDRLLRCQPALHVAVVEGTHEALLGGLRCGEVDLIVGALREASDEVRQTVLFDDELRVVVRPGHRLARRRSAALDELVHEPWVVPREGVPARARFERVFSDAGLPLPARRVEACSLVVVRGLLLEGDRVTMASPHQMHHELASGQLVTLPVDLGDTARPIGIAVRADAQPTRAVQSFIAQLRDTSAALHSPLPLARAAA